MRVVLDANVLVSALISTGGPPREIVSAWVEGRFELVTSPRLIAEMREVVARPKFRRWVRLATAEEFVVGLQEDTLLVDDPPAQPGASPDPDDDYLLALVAAAGADLLVSGDRHLLGLADPGVAVLSPREFFERLRQPS